MIIFPQKTNKKDSELMDELTAVESVEDLLKPHMDSIGDPEYDGLILIKLTSASKVPTTPEHIIDTLAFRLHSFYVSFNITIPPVKITFENGASISVIMIPETRKSCHMGIIKSLTSDKSPLLNRLKGLQFEQVTILKDDYYTEQELKYIQSIIERKP